MRRIFFASWVLAFSALPLSAMAAGNNNSPPAGAILDLAGGETGTAAQTINHGAPVSVSVNFTAGVTSTDITFAFREDPAYIYFGQVSLIDLTTGSSVNLLTNGNFAGGTYTAASGNTIPNGWNFDNVYGAAASGNLISCSAFASGFCWHDGSVQAYDAIDQVVSTTVGDSYALSFLYTDSGPYSLFSDLSTNGDTTDDSGNGVDILAYAQAGLPVACLPGTVCTNPSAPTGVPEPFTLSIFGAGVAGAVALRRRKKASA
jgi:hypothetical protein